MAGTALESALCLECNYPLRGLTAFRCPECGRVFDPSNATTFNTGRALTWLDRKLLAPLGWPVFTLLSLLCGGLFFIARDPGIYYMGGYVLLIGLFCFAAFAVLLIRRALRDSIPPRGVARPKDGRRWWCAYLLVIGTGTLVICHVPLRVGFLLAWPQLHQLVSDINDGSVTTPIVPQRAGWYWVGTSGYGGGDTHFFYLVGLNGGFAYCPNKDPAGEYNAGNHGLLIGDWYWWTPD